mgnify:CR=1 FL=1
MPPNKYKGDKKFLGELLSRTSPRIEVPDFQRSYSWESRQVEEFWNDLLVFSEKYPDENIQNEEYFLGSIVLVDNGESHLLLDGQQRLATATILISVIRDYLKKYNADAATRTHTKFICDFDDATGNYSYTLTLNIYDKDFFRQFIQEFPTETRVLPEPTLESHKLIRKAKDYFTERFEEEYRKLGGGKCAFDWALRIQRVLTGHFSVVVISSHDEDNAATVFETLNDRGIGLSTPDLLRNLLLRQANSTRREEIIECWRTVLEMDEDAKVEQFLRHYWLSKHGDVKTRTLYREIKYWIQANGVDSLEFSKELQQAANIYRDINSSRDTDQNIQRLLKDINDLGAKVLFPPILSAYSIMDGEIDARAMENYLKALISLYIRYVVVGNMETTKLESMLYDEAKALREHRNINQSIIRFKEFAPSDERFKELFASLREVKKQAARYILREIEHSRRETDELRVETPDRVHVEHIYPRYPLPEQKWPNHNLYVEMLGNLTLLDLKINASIKNHPFQQKKEYYRKSQLLITKELLEFDEWTPESITRRQEKMSEIAPQIWSFPNVTLE